MAATAGRAPFPEGHVTLGEARAQGIHWGGSTD
eukprot:COSAG02_NODE_19565_length_876_cov_0.831403_1_plen_32_part_01